MSDYTPTTEWVRLMVGYAKKTAVDRTLPADQARDEGYEWFDRWLERVRAEERERIAGLIDACWQGDKMDEWEYHNTLPDWRMGMFDAARIARQGGSDDRV